MTAIDTSHSHTVEVGYDEFCGALAARDLQSLWSQQTALMSEAPLPATRPWLWPWKATYPLAKHAGEVITLERGGDRRVLAFANPGLHGLPFTSTTLWGAIQYLGPGENAPAHRHSPSAIRFVMVGSGVYTTVNGDACEMTPGDLVLTPNWNWHDHNNYGGEPMVWFDGLDLPLMTTLESVFFENHPEQRQPVVGHNLSERMFGSVGLAPGGATEYDPAHSPLLRYAYVDVDRRLDELHERSGGPEATVEYLNPVTGGPVVATFTCEMSRLYPGARTPTRRKTGSSIYVAFSGSGQSVIDGVQFDWSAGDVFVSPSWSAVDHRASEQADLFIVSDRPVLKALYVYKEATEAEPQAIREVFQPS
jgi:gentisate 1,2-dioxygenase